MKRIIINIVLLFPLLTFVSAQKEVFFNTTKPEDVKVESLQGIETRFSLIPAEFQFGFLSFLSLPRFIYPAVYIGYFNEKRIADCWTLNSTIGLKYIATKGPIWQAQYDSINGDYATGSGTKNTFEMKLEVGVEPRWYWGYKKRYQFGISDLNSGWYLSFPTLFQTTLLNTPEPVLNLGLIPNYFQASASISPTLGFRQAIFRRWFLEGNIGLGVQVIVGIYNTSYDYSKKFYILSPTINPHCEIKAAYTFK